jgi:isochorismate synthase
MTLNNKLNYISDQLKELSQEALLQFILAWAAKHGLPSALWHQQNRTPKLIIGFSSEQPMDEDIQHADAGFCFAAFDGSKWMIKADLTLDLTNKTLSIDPRANAIDALDELTDIKQVDWHYPTKGQAPTSTSKSDFISQVEACIGHIQGEELIKVVPSRVKTVDLSNKFEPIQAFLKLVEAYPNSFVSMVSTPNVGTWLGATPEILIGIDEAQTFTTMSLAGTQSYDGNTPLHEVAWTQKEIEEQAIVSRYIINRFKEIRLREFEEIGPRTIQAANLAHLCSTYTVNMVATDYPDLGAVMLKLLHPTSAVCGMPKEPAMNLIQKMEAHDRKYYAGFLGPVNFEGRTDIYVNLRCMELFEHKATLYAGVGVTGYSNPEMEWQETELKCNTLLEVIEL